MPAKVYSIDIGKEDVLKDPRGILEINSIMADKMPKRGDGKLRIPMAYDITHKTTSTSASAERARYDDDGLSNELPDELLLEMGDT